RVELRFLSSPARRRARPRAHGRASGGPGERGRDHVEEIVDRPSAIGAPLVARHGGPPRGQGRDAGAGRGRRVNPAPVELSIVLPVFNEAQSLPILWEELQEVLKTVEDSAEVIVVDDGSTDSSVEFVRLQQLTDPRVRLIRLAANRGLSSALAAGLCAVRGRIVVTLDSDLQSDPNDIPLLLAQLDRADAAVGWRQARRDPWLKRVSSRIANRVRGAVLGDQVRDSACSLRAMHRRCVDSLPFFAGFHRFVPSLLRQAGQRVIVVPVNHRPRRFGVSHYGVRNRAWRGVVDMLGVRWLQARRLRYEAREEPPGTAWRRAPSRPPGRDIDDVRVRQEVEHRVTPYLEPGRS